MIHCFIRKELIGRPFYVVFFALFINRKSSSLFKGFNQLEREKEKNTEQWPQLHSVDEAEDAVLNHPDAVVEVEVSLLNWILWDPNNSFPGGRGGFTPRGRGGSRGGGRGRGGPRGGGRGGARGGCVKVIVEPHRHGGVFIAKGKEDVLVTKVPSNFLCYYYYYLRTWFPVTPSMERRRLK